MKYFYGKNKKYSYFEGWYFKHTNNKNLLALIPGINMDESGSKNAFIQVITAKSSYCIRYDYEDFYARTDRLFIKIGNNEFSEKGIKIKIDDGLFKCSGEIRYSGLTPLKSDIMGPFRFVPFMECNHGVISLWHRIDGEIHTNNKKMIFDNDTGYIEKDWGTSFPEKYFWLQCNDFRLGELSIMISIAEIPFLGANFTGCICSVYDRGKEYRLASYKGVKILKLSRDEVVVRQGDYLLKILIKSSDEHPLLAPSKGTMIRNIKETTLAAASFKFYYKDAIVFNETSSNVSYEWVDYNT